MTMQTTANGSGPAHAVAVLHGGGAPLKLKPTAGKIRLQFLDSEVALHESLIREQMDRLNKRLTENGFEAVSFSKGPGSGSSIPTEMPAPSETKTDWLESWLVNLEITFPGGITEDPDDFQKRRGHFSKASHS